jgi:predicted small secreted protein
MARLWRSIIVVGLCFAAVVMMRIYLNKQIEISKATTSSEFETGDVLAR